MVATQMTPPKDNIAKIDDKKWSIEILGFEKRFQKKNCKSPICWI